MSKVEARANRPERRTMCQYAWGNVYISSNGDVGPCCGVIDHGSLDTQEVVEIFSGEKASALRQTMLDGRIEDLHPACPNCINLARNTDPNSWLFSNFGYPTSLPADAPFFQNGAAIRETLITETSVAPGTAPLRMIVQFGELCNIQCIMCPQDHRSRERLKPEHIAKIKGALPWINYITFSGGEPLVFDEMWDILDEYQKQPQPKFVTILSNGKILTPERLRKHATGIEHLSFAINIDAGTKPTYEKIRAGASWDVLMLNLRNYLAFIREEKPGWGLAFGFTIMRSNYHEIRTAIDLIHAMGGGGCSFGPMTGDWFPAKNCRTFLEENIFCFPHLGYERQRLHDELMELADYAESKGVVWGETAANLRGVASYAMTVKQITFSAADAEAAKRLDDVALSEWMKRNVSEGPYPLSALITDQQRIIKERDTKLVEVSERLADIRSQEVEMASREASVNARIAKSVELLAAKDTELADLSGKLESAQAAISAMTTSTSWKVSAPVRAVRRLLRSAMR